MTEIFSEFLKSKNKKVYLQGCDGFKLCSLSKEIRKSEGSQISTKSSLFLLQSLIDCKKKTKQVKYLQYELISLISTFLPKTVFTTADPKEMEILVDFIIICITMEHPCKKHARPGLAFKELLQKDQVLSKAISKIGYSISSQLSTIIENGSSRLWIMLNLLNEINLLQVDNKLLILALKTHSTKETTLSQISRLLLHSDLKGLGLDDYKMLLQLVKTTTHIESTAFLLDTILIQSISHLDLRKVLADGAFHRFCLSLLKTVKLEKSDIKQRLYVFQGVTALMSIMETSLIESERKVGLSVIKLLINSLAWLFSVELSLDLDPPISFSASKYEPAFLLSIVKPKFLESVLGFINVKMKIAEPNSLQHSGLLSVCLNIFHFISLSEYPAKYEQKVILSTLLVKVMNRLGKDFIQEVRPQTFVAAAVDVTMFAKNMLETQGAMAEACMRLLNIYISHKRSRTALSDEGAVSLLLEEQISSLIIEMSETQELPRSMVLSFLENAAKDSAVRFKMKQKSILFFLRLIEASFSINTAHMDTILRRSLLYLNEHFGFDLVTLNYFSAASGSDGQSSLLFKLIDMLVYTCKQQLNLDCEDYMYSAETNLAAVHMVDSILRTENGKTMVVENFRIGDLIEVGTNTAHTEIPSIIAKLVSRILTDHALTMQLSITYSFSNAFTKLGRSSLLNPVEEAIALHKSELLVPLLSLFDYSIANQLHTAISIIHVAPTDLINSLILAHPIRNPITKSKSLSIWGQILVAYQAGLYPHANAAITYAKHKIVNHRLPRVIKCLDPSSVLILNLLEGHKVDSLLFKGEGLLEFSFPDHQSLFLSKSQFTSASSVFKAMTEDAFFESISHKIVIKDVEYELWFKLLSFIVMSESEDILHTEFHRPPSLDDLEIVYSLVDIADKFLVSDLHLALICFLKDAMYYLSTAKQEPQLLSIFCYLKGLEGFQFSGKEKVELLELAAVSLLGSF